MATLSEMVQYKEDDSKLISNLYSQIEKANEIICQLITDLAYEPIQTSIFEPKLFSKWGGPDGIEEYIKQETGCAPFAAAGINPRPAQKTTIIRSVDDTKFYADDLSDMNHPKYTLYGHDGDQDENEKKFNEPLLNPYKTEKIYLYQVRKNGKKIEYVWYGKYIIDGKNTKRHPGKNGIMRTIILVTLKRI
jgi:hypothetical protein